MKIVEDYLIAIATGIYLAIGICFAFRRAKFFSFDNPVKPFVFIFVVWFWPLLLIDFLVDLLEKTLDKGGERK